MDNILDYKITYIHLWFIVDDPYIIRYKFCLIGYIPINIDKYHPWFIG